MFLLVGPAMASLFKAPTAAYEKIILELNKKDDRNLVGPCNCRLNIIIC